MFVTLYDQRKRIHTRGRAFGSLNLRLVELVGVGFEASRDWLNQGGSILSDSHSSTFSFLLFICAFASLINNYDSPLRFDVVIQRI